MIREVASSTLRSSLVVVVVSLALSFVTHGAVLNLSRNNDHAHGSWVVVKKF